MYHAKHSGSNKLQYFSQDLEKNARRRLLLENSLRQAIDNSEFELYLQPKISLDNHKVESAEALLRWKLESEFIPPPEFISIAEQSGLILEIDQWVIDQACRVINACKAMKLTPPRIAVNLSAMDIRDEMFVSNIISTFERHNISGHNFEFELTETVLLEHNEKVTLALEQLKQQGITLSIDDFGTGYSSIAYLQKLPIDNLKVDKSFIINLEQQPQDKVLVRSIIKLAHSLNLKVVAEGVEDKSSVDFLSQNQCDFAQGFFFHRPMPVKNFLDLLKSHQESAS